jgi:serine O-acetyltransferase
LGDEVLRDVDIQSAAVIGEGSKIAAGSVVLCEVPPNSTVAGIPARVVGRPKTSEPSRQMDQYVEFDYCI